MKEGLLIKACWALYKRPIISELPILGVKNPAEVFKKAQQLYNSEMNRLPDYSQDDVLKLNLAHAVMLGAIYESCPEKPDINALTKFYHDFILKPKIVRLAFSKAKMLSPSNIRRQVKIGETSQYATHPFTWQFKVKVEDKSRFTADFTRCGIYDYLSSRGLGHIVPAMCALDYTFGEIGNHWFLRESTIATGGKICDCHYVDKTVATREEIERSKRNRREEAMRGGRAF